MDATARQLPLDLGHRSASGREDFLLAPSNRDAVAWIDLWPEWPAPALILHGPESCGKSHLAAVWSGRAKALRVDPARLASSDPRDVWKDHSACVMDGADICVGDRAAETTLFHMYNMAKDEGRTMLITFRTAPIRQDFTLPDLASRLRAAPAAMIQAPDETLLAALLVKLFADRQLQVGEDVIQYILPRRERSFAAARDIVQRADSEALAKKRNISVPLIREILPVED
jgi:chromosomal replication initiation ATPase DnaA